MTPVPSFHRIKHWRFSRPTLCVDRYDGCWSADEDWLDKGRSTRSDLKIGICGEHGEIHPRLVFCHKIGLNYVSCSPFRVPIARLGRCQAALKDAKK